MLPSVTLRPKNVVAYEVVRRKSNRHTVVTFQALSDESRSLVASQRRLARISDTEGEAEIAKSLILAE